MNSIKATNASTLVNLLVTSAILSCPLQGGKRDQPPAHRRPNQPLDSPLLEDPPRLAHHLDPIGPHQTQAAHHAIHNLSSRPSSRKGHARALGLDDPAVLADEVERDDLEILGNESAGKCCITAAKVGDEGERREGGEGGREESEGVDGPVGGLASEAGVVLQGTRVRRMRGESQRKKERTSSKAPSSFIVTQASSPVLV